MAIKINKDAHFERYEEIASFLPKSANDILSGLGEALSINPTLIRLGSPTKKLSIVRQYSQWLIKRHYKISLRKVGDLYNHEHHTTIMHSISQVETKFSVLDKALINIHNTYYTHLKADVYSFQEFARPIKNAIFA